MNLEWCKEMGESIKAENKWTLISNKNPLFDKTGSKKMAYRHHT